MNERIRELAAKTGIYGAVDINGNYDNEAEVKKFAELIVQECANYITEYYPHSRYEAFYMKKHFGVK
jgi:tRNA G26 N,N-dimethylase Trm1